MNKRQFDVDLMSYVRSLKRIDKAFNIKVFNQLLKEYLTKGIITDKQYKTWEYPQNNYFKGD